MLAKLRLVAKPYKKKNVKTVQNPLTLFPRFLGSTLLFVGKPFYKLLVGMLLLITTTAYLVGHPTRVLFEKTFKLLTTSRPKVVKKKKRVVAKKKKSKSKKIAPLFFLRVKLALIRLGSKIRLPKKAPKLPIFPKVSFSLMFIFVILAASTYLIWSSIFRDLPHPTELVTRQQEVSTKIYDRNGVLLYKIYKDKNRTIVSLSEVPNHVRLATLAAEDAEFYQHPGFSVKGIIRSLGKNIRTGTVSGGSTITQQLVKNALLSSEKTLTRKIRELILSVGVELNYSKDQILEMYLNEVSYGGTAYGIQEASRVYFDKDVNQLSLSEAALLAGLPQSPTKFSPFGPTPEASFSRQKEVLHLMGINRYITDEERVQAEGERITFAANKIDIKAPHFVMYVRDILENIYGREAVEKGGLEVTTTLDYNIQLTAESVVADEIEKLKGLNVTNGAAVVLEPKTGEVLAMVGSKDYFDTASDGNVNVVTRLRPPGSSIKVVNYAYALSNKYTAASILADTPITFSVPGQAPYIPKNYDGKFRGNITLRSALAESRNIPAVKLLASYGVGKMIELGKNMGITTWEDESRFGLSLTLGGGEVKLIDLAQVYATIANYGRRPEIVPILKVTNYKAETLDERICAGRSHLDTNEEESPCNQEQVLDPKVAFILIDILKDNIARSPAFGSSSQLVIPNHPEVAVKTGTSNDLRDNLAVGFNQDVLVAVWVGNNDNSPMSRVASGVTGASPIWNKIVRSILSEKQSTAWTAPQGLTKVGICGGGKFTEWFITGTAPKGGCIPVAVENKNSEEKKPGIL